VKPASHDFKNANAKIQQVNKFLLLAIMKCSHYKHFMFAANNNDYKH